jgi:hypothetical protein
MNQNVEQYVFSKTIKNRQLNKYIAKKYVNLTWHIMASIYLMKATKIAKRQGELILKICVQRTMYKFSGNTVIEDIF